MNKQELIDYCRADCRICPMPPQWAKLDQMMIDAINKVRPPRALILGSWFDATDIQKIEQVANQIEWADKHGIFALVHDFLISLNAQQWYLEGQ
jgi:hypothetical protein